MLDMKITDDYKISSDEHNIILEKKRVSKKGKINSWSVVGYYPMFEMAADELVEKNIREMDAKSLKELSNSIEALKDAIKRLHKPLNER